VNDYLTKTNYILQEVFFRYKELSFRGHGILKWEPNAGFNIEASINPCARAAGQKTIFDNNIIKVLMKPNRYDRAIATQVLLDAANTIDIFANKHVSLNSSHVFFFRHSLPNLNSTMFRASALYNLGSPPVFPDSVYTETHIKHEGGDHKIHSRAARAAIWYEGPQGQNLSGRLIDNAIFSLNWVFPIENYTKEYCWNFAEFFRYALSILSGQVVQLLNRELEIGPYKRLEKRKSKSAKSLGFLKPYPRYLLNKHDLIKLTEFFGSGSKESRICLKIFNQMADASQQQTLEGAQLLLSTILEAALRTIYNQPFSKNDKHSFNRYECMQQFREEYLGDKWSDACDRTLDVFKKLRHRNAHPDWLISESGTWSTQALEKDLDEMAFLSQFYGYMIKALAGYRDMKPEFIR